MWRHVCSAASHRFLAIAAIAILLQGCGDSPPEFHTNDSPLRLSEWNLLSIEERQLTANAQSIVFIPANTLFSDYAHKFRSLWIPVSQQISLRNGELNYPVGTVLSKTFYYRRDSDGRFVNAADSGELTRIDLNEHRLLETRLLVRRENAWVGLPYIWNEEQTEAFLRVAGGSRAVELDTGGETKSFTYFIPNENQCAACHTTEHPDGGMHPLGAIAAQLQDQLESLRMRGWLEETPEIKSVITWQDESMPVDQRARAYLNMNCAHCHNPTGPADTSALLLHSNAKQGVDMGVCKPPVAAGSGAGSLRFGIVPGKPEESILLFRMQSTNPAIMMPELGRVLVHEEGVDLISRWIADMPGSCN